MGLAETYSCDKCGVETSPGIGTTLIVLAYQGYESGHGLFDVDRWNKTGQKYKMSMTTYLCDDCVGEKVQRCHGDTPPFGISKAVISKLLSRLGFSKMSPDSVGT